MLSRLYQPNVRSQINYEMRIPLNLMIKAVHLFNRFTPVTQQRKSVHCIQVSAKQPPKKKAKIHRLLPKETPL